MSKKSRSKERITARHYETMRLYNEEVSNYLVLLESRRESLYTRGGLLVASAAIATAIATSSTLTFWTAAAMTLGTASAALGIIALWPRPTPTIDMEEIRNGLFSDERTESVTRTADSKFVNSHPVLKQLNRIAQLVRVGFLLLVAAIASAIAHALDIIITIGAFDG